MWCVSFFLAIDGDNVNSIYLFVSQTVAMEAMRSPDNVQIIARRKECKHCKECKSACMM